jgi:hypothetical protein
MQKIQRRCKMTKTALLLAIFTLPLMIGGCGKSVQPSNATADDTSRLCSSVLGAGLDKQCAAHTSDSTVHIIIDSFDDEAARNACADIANKMAQLTADFSGKWMLQVYSLYRSDKPLATCPLY